MSPFKILINTISTNTPWLEYETMKATESLYKNGERFDENDWDAIIKIAQKNDILLSTIANSQYLSQYAVDKLLNIYRYNNQELVALQLELIKNNSLGLEQLDKCLDNLLKSGSLQMEMIRTQGKSEFCMPLSDKAATILINKIKNNEIKDDLCGMPFRCYDCSSESKQKELMQLIKNNELNEVIYSELINNPTLPTTIKEEIFDNGFKPLLIINSGSKHIQEQLYFSAMETIENYSETLNAPSIVKDAEAIILKMIENKTLPECCEIDMINRYKNLKTNQQYLIHHMKENTKNISTLCLLSDINLTDANIAQSVLISATKQENIPQNIKEKHFEKIIEYYNQKDYLLGDENNSYNISLKHLLLTCPLSDKSYQILKQIGNDFTLKQIAQSQKTSREILKDLSINPITDIRFYAQLNIKLREQGFENYIKDIMYSIDQIFKYYNQSEDLIFDKLCLKNLSNQQLKKFQEIINDTISKTKPSNKTITATKYFIDKQIEKMKKCQINKNIQHLFVNKNENNFDIEKIKNLKEETVQLLIQEMDVKQLKNLKEKIESFIKKQIKPYFSSSIEYKIKVYENILALEDLYNQTQNKIKEIEQIKNKNNQPEI